MGLRGRAAFPGCRAMEAPLDAGAAALAAGRTEASGFCINSAASAAADGDPTLPANTPPSAASEPWMLAPPLLNERADPR